MTAHAPHSLPSFAQAFSEPSLGSISSGNNSLPPIHMRSPAPLSRRAKSPKSQPPSRYASEEDRVAGRKRPRAEFTSSARDEEPSDSGRDSPHLTRVKEEQDQDIRNSPPTQQRGDQTGVPPSSVQLQPSSAKKRRVTVSGGAAPLLNIDVRVPADQSSSTPISPVVMGFTIRDNPSAMEQMRSSYSQKQKQKALIEQRRGSLAGSPSIGAGPPPASLVEEKTNPTTRQRRSPNTDTRRAANGVQGRPPSPGSDPVQSLPPPPISFARRRAEQLGGKRKPADIIISPREAQTQEQFQPAIQSAPPIPQGGQGSLYSGRFAMALPRLPPAMGGGENIRKVPGYVPPTPTRLSLQRNNSSTAIPSISHPTTTTITRSPPAASIPIASTLVPPTPTSFHRSGYSGDKSAFLAPFEHFYDALNDSRQLKTWLGEQLLKSNTLIQNLTQQQEKINETVENMVERKMASMRAEMAGLYRRVDELEDALRAATGRRQSVDSGSVMPKGKRPLRSDSPMASETYTFPPRPQPDRTRGEPSRRHPSPGWSQDRDTLESENGSPAPFDARRLSLSSARLDPPRTQGFETSSQRNTLSNLQSPPQGYRESPQRHSSPSSHGKTNNHPAERASLHRAPPHPQTPASAAERSKSPQNDATPSSPGTMTVDM
ncbi:hypothetical protein GGX14DRAFT_519786 [Mycena pura]|uniref:Uncharacterized protein n=1 Tax=Mycena pura TaxID=153505 RepID=A0AAD6VGC7_9AGAR|nr:hypothetical protein GGX14DRAFT_519786 [Mycena pura]